MFCFSKPCYRYKIPVTEKTQILIKICPYCSNNIILILFLIKEINNVCLTIFYENKLAAFLEDFIFENKLCFLGKTEMLL